MNNDYKKQLQLFLNSGILTELAGRDIKAALADADYYPILNKSEHAISLLGVAVLERVEAYEDEILSLRAKLAKVGG